MERGLLADGTGHRARLLCLADRPRGDQLDHSLNDKLNDKLRKLKRMASARWTNAYDSVDAAVDVAGATAGDGDRSEQSDVEPTPAVATVSSGLSLHEFRRRYDAGQLSLDKWEEGSIAPSEAGRPPDDPHGADYAEWVMATWRAVTKREKYEPEVDETFEIPGDEFLARPYPYSSSNPTEVSNYLGAVAAVVARIGVPPPARVVEYGSGWGHLASTLAATGYDVSAIDLNPASVELLRRRSSALGVPLNVVQSSFLDHHCDSPVDVIVFFEAFHHCERPFELFDRCADALSPSGRMVFIAEAIYDDFYAPWGVRLDGSAAFMAAQQGWLELGFPPRLLRGRAARSVGSTRPGRCSRGSAWYGTVMVAERVDLTPPDDHTVQVDPGPHG